MHFCWMAAKKSFQNVQEKLPSNIVELEQKQVFEVSSKRRGKGFELRPWQILKVL